MKLTSKRGFIALPILIFAAAVAVGVVGYFGFIAPGGIVVKNTTMPGGRTACTQEAMLCPDGTAVGRTGPNCEFEKCPNIPTATSVTTPTTPTTINTASWLA